MATSFDGFNRKLRAIEDDLSDRRVMSRIGVAAKRDVEEAVRGDLGDMNMSNFPRRGRPVNLAARFDVVGDDSVKVAPAGKAKGGLRILNDGRQAGVSRSRRGRVSRNVGATAAKRTWDDAVKIMERRTPERFARELNGVLRRHLTGG